MTGLVNKDTSRRQRANGDAACEFAAAGTEALDAASGVFGRSIAYPHDQVDSVGSLAGDQ